MSDIRVNAIVIRAINYSENDRLLTLLTLERGRITAKIKGCKSPKSKLRYAASLLSFGEYLLVEKDSRYTVTGCNSKDSFQLITEDINKYYVASIIMETANRLTEDSIECSELFLTVLRLLNILCYQDIDPKIIAVKAILDIMKVSGYGLNLECCAICGDSKVRSISLTDGGVVCDKHYRGDNVKVSSNAINLLRMINEGEYEDMDIIEIDTLLLKEAINTLNIFYTYQLESTLKSISQFLMII